MIVALHKGNFESPGGVTMRLESDACNTIFLVDTLVIKMTSASIVQIIFLKISDEN